MRVPAFNFKDAHIATQAIYHMQLHASIKLPSSCTIKTGLEQVGLGIISHNIL